MLEKILYKRNAMPEYITFFITNRCNLKCEHCFLWKKLNQSENELTLKEIEKISKSMKRFAVLSLTGGEPFLRKDLHKIVKIFYTNNKIKWLVIPTNGTIEIKETLKKIINQCPKLEIKLFISIEDTRDKLAYNKSIKTFKELKEIKNIKLGTATTFSNLNQNRIFDIHKWIKKNLEPDMMNFPLIRGDVKDESIKEINIDVYEKLMKKVKNNGLIGKAKRLMTKINIKTIRENKRIIPCYAGVINAVIYPNGDVYPCELLNKKMGNLKEFDLNFEKLWFSDKGKQIRKEIKDIKCFCTHGCNMLPNIIFNPRLIFRWLFTLPSATLKKGN